MWAFYVISMLFVVVATMLLLRYYAAPGVPLFVRAIAIVAWVTSLSIVALVPVDVLNSLQGTSGSLTGPLGILWSISYWTTQALCWALVPLTMGFVDAGEFSFIGRFLEGIKDNAQTYCMIGAGVGAGLLALLISGRLTLANISPLALTLSNTYGLVAGVFLLGYGLVEIPRGLWNQANPEERLRYVCYKLGRAADILEDAASELQAVITVVEATSQPMSRRDALRGHMDTIYKYAQDKSPFKPSMVPRDSGGRVDLESLKDGELDYGCDQAGLAVLRQRLRAAVHNYEGQFASYGNVVSEALELGTVCSCRSSRDYTQKAVTGAKPLRPEWMMYKCVVKPWLMRISALVLAATSFMVVWSEATIGLGRRPDLSPFSLACLSIPSNTWRPCLCGGTYFALYFLPLTMSLLCHMDTKAAKAIHTRAHGELMYLLLVMGPLGYMVLCCQYSLLRLGFINVFSFRHHVVPHCTHSTSLLRNGAWACRFMAPICYNYLHVIRMQEYFASGETMVFSKKMGAALEDVPLFGTAFNNWFPIVVLFWCGALFLNVWQVIARFVLPARYRFDDRGGSNEHMERGQVLMRKEEDARLRQLPVASCLDIWGVVEAPAGTPSKSSWFSRGKDKTQTANASGSKISRSRSDLDDLPAEASRWSQANLSAATQHALSRGRTQLSYPHASKSSPGVQGLSVPPGRVELSSDYEPRGDNRKTAAVIATVSGRSAAVQPVAKSGLDQIFARMGPDANKFEGDNGRIDDDERDGSLLGGQEDSVYGSRGDWKSSRR